jgi:hypothetical protein
VRGREEGLWGQWSLSALLSLPLSLPLSLS